MNQLCQIHTGSVRVCLISAPRDQETILTEQHLDQPPPDPGPFLLRRVKTNVDLEIPLKKEALVYCPLTASQMDLYSNIVEKTIKVFTKEDSDKTDEVLPEKLRKQQVGYSVFFDEKEFAANNKKLRSTSSTLPSTHRP